MISKYNRSTNTSQSFCADLRTYVVSGISNTSQVAVAAFCASSKLRQHLPRSDNSFTTLLSNSSDFCSDIYIYIYIYI